MPFCAFTVADAPGGIDPTVTAALHQETRFPYWSCTRTISGGEIATPGEAFEGCVLNAILLALLGLIVNELFVALENTDSRR